MGLTRCNLAGDGPRRRGDTGCIQKWPELDPYDRDVFAFFMAIQHCWRGGEFSGVRTALIRTEIEIEARIRGYALTEHFLDRLRICESVITAYDRKRNATPPPNGANTGQR